MSVAAPLTEEQLQEVRTTLKRCSPATLEAAIRFRETRDPACVPTIVYGIIERHMPPEAPQKLAEATDETELIKDLGIDSLTMLEIVLQIEETIGISIDNSELREIRTLGAVKSFIDRKLSGATAAESAGAAPGQSFGREDIALLLPQQPPFLFLDSAEVAGERVTAKYHIRGDEHFLEGHFKDQPVFPATIVFEALGQACCLWLLHTQGAPEDAKNDVVFASMEEAHFHRRARPGDTLEFTVELDRLRAPLAIFRGSVQCAGKRVAEVRKLMLAFGPGIADQAEGLAEQSDKVPSVDTAPASNGTHAPAPLDAARELAVAAGVRV